MSDVIVGVEIELCDFNKAFGYDERYLYVSEGTHLEDISDADGVVDTIYLDGNATHLRFYYDNGNVTIVYVLGVRVDMLTIGSATLSLKYESIVKAFNDYNKITSRKSNYQHLLVSKEPKLYFI
jgi:hypothetical protein